jgi:hypothetical protein
MQLLIILLWHDQRSISQWFYMALLKVFGGQADAILGSMRCSQVLGTEFSFSHMVDRYKATGKSF